MAEDDNIKKKIKNTMYKVKGKNNMPTVALIVLAIELSIGSLSSNLNIVQKDLDNYLKKMPCAEHIINQMRTAKNCDALLAKRILPFNFC